MASLTKAQCELLELAAIGEIEVTFQHPDAKALADMGLLAPGVSSMGKGGGFIAGRFHKITPAGRAAISKDPS